MRYLALVFLAACLLTGCTNTEWKTEHRGKLVDFEERYDVGPVGAAVKFEDGAIIPVSGRNIQACPWMKGQEYLYQTRIQTSTNYWRPIHPQCLEVEVKQAAGSSTFYCVMTGPFTPEAPPTSSAGSESTTR